MASAVEWERIQACQTLEGQETGGDIALESERSEGGIEPDRGGRNRGQDQGKEWHQRIEKRNGRSWSVRSEWGFKAMELKNLSARKRANDA